MDTELKVPIRGEEDIIMARQSARELAKRLGFGLVDQSRIATAVSELTRNVVRYATDGIGEMRSRNVADGAGRSGIEIVVADNGPGIEDIEQAFAEGYTTGRGMGLGLPGARRLVDEMVVDSALGRGTIVTMRKWRR